MKLSLIRVLPLAIALLVPSAALAEDHAQKSGDTPAAGAPAHKARATHTAKRAKAGPKAKPAKATKAPKAAKKAPKAAKKAPKAAKKAAK